MRIIEVADVLADKGLAPPELRALVPDADNYVALILQPLGTIDATNTGFRSRDRDLAQAQFGKLLQDATASQPDLLVTPEYSMPWDVLINAISQPMGGPHEGSLWALGCESIKYSELQQLQQIPPNTATVLLEPMQADDTRFVDPLVYVFRAPRADNNHYSQLVLLIQFKTHAMADPRDFERNHLQTGQDIYRFGRPGASISLLTFVCSDLLGLTDDVAQNVYDRALILHILLNGDRRHQSLLDFRGQLLRMSGDSTEILTLNWARGTKVFIDGADMQLGKSAGSAWYLKVDRIALDDNTLASNHRKGLYYTWLASRRAHAMILNFLPAAYRLTASKVVRLGVPGPAGTRRGPLLDRPKIWNAGAGEWTATDSLSDDFDGLIDICGGATEQVRQAYNECPIACERLLALCAGDLGTTDHWYEPTSLDSFRLDPTENIFRLTFCQASHNTESQFRLQRLQRCGFLWAALQDRARLPLALNDIADGYTLEWVPAAKHQNLRSHADHRGRATVMHLGNTNKEAAQAAHDMARQRVHSSLDEVSAHAARQRVATWYTDAQGIFQVIHTTPQYDDNIAESPVDIARQA